MDFLLSFKIYVILLIYNNVYICSYYSFLSPIGFHTWYKYLKEIHFNNKRCLRGSKNPHKISFKGPAPLSVTFLGDCFCQKAFLFVTSPQPQRMFLSTLVILNILRQTLNCLRIALHGDS